MENENQSMECSVKGLVYLNKQNFVLIWLGFNKTMKKILLILCNIWK